MRSNMLEIMQDDFITMGRLMGYGERRLMVRHAARNALLPVVTALALGIGYAISGNVVVENVFGWPGLGRMLVQAVSASDYPLAQGAFLVHRNPHARHELCRRHHVWCAGPARRVHGAGKRLMARNYPRRELA